MSSVPQYSAPNAPFVYPDGRLTFAANTFLRDLWLRSGGPQAITTTELEMYIGGLQMSDPKVREVTQTVEELRQELASVRGDNTALRSRIEDMEAALLDATRPDTSLAARIDQLEGRLV